MTRLDFIKGTTSLGAVATGGCRLFTGCAGDWDDSLSVFLSDIHVNGVKGRPEYQIPRLASAVAEILRHDPLPRRCLVFGDLAWIFGEAADYAASAPYLKQLSDAGIEVVVTTGNHDHRRPMFEAYPECERRTPVSGRLTRKVEMPGADFILLDSLDENLSAPGAGNPVPGTLDEAQGEWLAEELKRRTNPVFVGCHHPLGELKYKGEPLAYLLADAPCVAGFVHGHDHRWRPDWVEGDWSGRHGIVRTLCLPSTGHWGDIGYTWFRTEATRAVAELRQTDFYFPVPLAKDAKRPLAWQAQIDEHRQARMSFDYAK